MKGKTALEIIQARYGDRPGFKEAVAREKALSDRDPAVLFARLSRVVRKKLKISQEDLAKIMKVTQPRISQIESENDEGSQLETYIRFYNALGCTLHFQVELPEEYVNEQTDTSYDLAFPPHRVNA